MTNTSIQVLKTMTKYLLLLIILVTFCQGQEFGPDETLHHHSPNEWNVESPQNAPCVTERGFYGRNAKFDQTMYYRYELYLKEGEYVAEATSMGAEESSQPAGLQGVLSAIETGIADALLESDVFDSVCAGGVARGPFPPQGNRRLLRKESRQMRAVGISTNPEDQVLEGLVCEEYVEGYEGPCMVVDGEFTIFLDIYEELGDQLELFLIDLMNIQTALDGAHPYIEKVRYIDLRPDSITGSEEEEEEDVRQTGANTALTSGFYAVVAAGAFLVLGTAIFYRRRRARIQDGDASTNFPSSDQVLE